MRIQTLDSGYIDTDNQSDYEKIYGESMDDNIYI